MTIDISNINESVYKSTVIEILGNKFSVMEVTGRYAYINIKKITNNPFGTLGKDFKSWDTACRHYKSPAMKTALLMAEMNFKNS